MHSGSARPTSGTSRLGPTVGCILPPVSSSWGRGGYGILSPVALSAHAQRGPGTPTCLSSWTSSLSAYTVSTRLLKHETAHVPQLLWPELPLSSPGLPSTTGRLHTRLREKGAAYFSSITVCPLLLISSTMIFSSSGSRTWGADSLREPKSQHRSHRGERWPWAATAQRDTVRRCKLGRRH